MSITVIPVRTNTNLKKFINLPWQIYRGNEFWVPPLIKDMKKTLNPDNNISVSRDNMEMFLALLDGKPAARILVAYDKNLNEKKSSKIGYFSLFECINDVNISKALLDSAMKWFIDKNISEIIGPVGPTGTDSDEYKGLLVDAFDKAPFVMNSYNLPYYAGLLEKYGFEKDQDLYAYYLDKDNIFSEKTAKVIEYAKKKYDFRVEPINFKNLEVEVKAIKRILDLAIPDEWPDLVAPSIEDVWEMARKLKPVADPEIVIIARSGNKPVGFGLALPDYNQVMKHINGRITPLGAIKYLWYKRKINAARVFVMFVVPEFRKKGVSYAIYHQIFVNGVKNGYLQGEGSTIGETNQRMRSDIESFGGKRCKTYRIYKKQLTEKGNANNNGGN